MAVMHQAQDAFVAEVDGVPFSVAKGDVLPAAHPLVKLDKGRGRLWKPLDTGDDPKPAKAAAAAKAGEG
jgi:hypothetical protein